MLPHNSKNCCNMQCISSKWQKEVCWWLHSNMNFPFSCLGVHISSRHIHTGHPRVTSQSPLLISTLCVMLLSAHQAHKARWPHFNHLSPLLNPRLASPLTCVARYRLVSSLSHWVPFLAALYWIHNKHLSATWTRERPACVRALIVLQQHLLLHPFSFKAVCVYKYVSECVFLTCSHAVAVWFSLQLLLASPCFRAVFSVFTSIAVKYRLHCVLYCTPIWPVSPAHYIKWRLSWLCVGVFSTSNAAF